MLIHLETGCHMNYWDTAKTQFALMIFTKRNPDYYGVNADKDGPITCGCQGKTFSKVSALCQHLESETCTLRYSGPGIVRAFVSMLRDAEWVRNMPKKSYSTLDFSDVIKRWGNRVYR
jgi:hypothetical protein